MRGAPAVIPKNIFQVISSQACHGKDAKCFIHDVMFINCPSLFSDEGPRKPKRHCSSPCEYEGMGKLVLLVGETIFDPTIRV